MVRKDKKVNPVDTMGDLLNMIEGMIPGGNSTIKRTIVKNYIVSTVDTKDMGPETAVLGDTVIPVERYKTTKLALEGHDKWVKYVEDNYSTELKLTMLGYGNLIDDALSIVHPMTDEQIEQNK